jgi:hypothetical protein
MLFDSQLVFFGSAPYASVSNYQTLAAVTAGGTASATIDLGVAEDMGIGDGEAVPKLAFYVGTAVTSACTGTTINVQFRGSTDSTHWTVYAESGALTTASFTAGAKIFPIDVPHRPAGAALPRYYDLFLSVAGVGGSETISAGSVLAGIVIQRNDNPVGKYASGYTVV